MERLYVGLSPENEFCCGRAGRIGCILVYVSDALTGGNRGREPWSIRILSFRRGAKSFGAPLVVVEAIGMKWRRCDTLLSQRRKCINDLNKVAVQVVLSIGKIV